MRRPTGAASTGNRRPEESSEQDGNVSAAARGVSVDSEREGARRGLRRTARRADRRPAPSTAPSPVVIVGGGAAGLGLAYRLAESGVTGVTVLEPRTGPRAHRAHLVLLGARRGRLRRGGHGLLVAAARPRPDGRPVTVDPAPLRYRMLRSPEFERLVHARLARSPGTRILRATANAVRDTAGGAEVHCTTADGRPLTLRARLVFDSRPRRPCHRRGPG